jgi:hypothetical protein
MSIPIVYCRVIKALESPEAMESLKKDMKSNLEQGYFTVWSCQHTPKCREITEEEQERVEAILLELMKEIAKERKKLHETANHQ